MKGGLILIIALGALMISTGLYKLSVDSKFQNKLASMEALGDAEADAKMLELLKAAVKKISPESVDKKITEVTALSTSSSSKRNMGGFKEVDLEKILEIIGNTFPVIPTAEQVKTIASEIRASANGQYSKVFDTSSVEENTDVKFVYSLQAIFAVKNAAIGEEPATWNMNTYHGTKSGRYLPKKVFKIVTKCSSYMIFFTKCVDEEVEEEEPRKVTAAMKLKAGDYIKDELAKAMLEELSK